MISNYYPDPVNRLLTLGDTDISDWVEYGRHGIGAEHAPQLFRMAGDKRLYGREKGSPELWAPLHACRALAELCDPRLVAPLISLLTAYHYTDEELDTIAAGLAFIGAPALGPCAEAILNPGLPLFSRWAVADAIGKLGEHHPHVRDDCVEALTRPLHHPDWHEPDVLSTAVEGLAALGATDRLPLIKPLFEVGEIGRLEYKSWKSLVRDFEDPPMELTTMPTVGGAPWPPDADVYRIRVQLQDIEPPIWREIEVLGDATLCRLHHVIQAALGWLNSHLYDFEGPEGRYDDPSFDDDYRYEYDPIPQDAREVRLSEVAAQTPTSLVYQYDFGDSWYHDVEILEHYKATAERWEYPRCLDGARAAPPEDCGGVSGYEELLEALADPEHPERDTWIVWAQGYDPEQFDLDEVNQAMRGSDWR